MSASQVMRVAQGLYERGYITYMRTDSTTLSEHRGRRGALAGHRRSFGSQYLADGPGAYAKEGQERAGGPRGDPSGGRDVPHPGRAHAASSAATDLRLYELIWQRTLASQMADATGQTVTVRIGATTSTGERRRVLGERHDDHVPRLPARLRRGRRRPDAEARATHERLLPTLAVGQARPARGPRAERPHDAAAGALHRGLAREEARGAGHRPPVHVRLDHADDPGPRLRVEEGPGPRADHGPRSRSSACSSSTSTTSSTTRSPRAWRTTSTRSPRNEVSEGQWLGTVLVRQRRPRASSAS